MLRTTKRSSIDEGRLGLAGSARDRFCDPLPTNILKECIVLLVPYITKLFNLSLHTATVPQQFKVSYITPLIKKPGLDPDLPENYRPISNLSFLSKVLERAVFT